jgi:ribosomal protein L37AE/L43A
MAYQETSKFCSYCGKQVLARRPGTNHILHLLLTLITAGFWLIIWVLTSVKFGGWRCSICGQKVTSNPSKNYSRQDVVYSQKMKKEPA